MMVLVVNAMTAQEVMDVQERADLSEGVCDSCASAQPGCSHLESRRYACSTRIVDLSRVCSDRYGGPVPVPGIPGSLPALVRCGSGIGWSGIVVQEWNMKYA